MPEQPTGNILTRKVGPLPGWQWGAIAVVVAGGYILWRRRQAAGAGASSGTGTTAQDVTGVSATPAPPVVIVQQPSQPSTTTTPTTKPVTPPKPAPAPQPAHPPTPVPPAINWKAFPQFISGLSPQGGTLRSFATVENGKVVGGQVRNGAPVYALIESKQYGPVWEQGFNPAKLPNGTHVATLPQFNNLIVSGRAA